MANAVRRGSDPESPLLKPLEGPFEVPELESPRTEAGRWRRWAPLLKTSSALTVAGVSLYAQIANWSAGWRAASGVGIGLGVGGLVNTLVDNRYTSRVQQVVLSTFAGQVSFYIVDTLWANVKTSAARRVCPPVIGAMLGVNLALYGKQLIQRGFALRSESQPASDSVGRKFEGVFWSEKWQYAKLVAVAACVAGYIWARKVADPIYEDMAAFGLTLYTADFVAQKAYDYVERKIQAAANTGLRGLTKLQESWWRIGKTAVNTVGFFAIPIMWAVVHNVQIWTVGTVTGLFEGFAFRSQERRFQNIPIEQLDELKARPPVENRCFHIWRKTWPLVASLFVTGFMLYEWRGDPDIRRDDRITLVFFYVVGMLPTAALNLWTELTWSVEKRAATEAGRPLTKQWWQDVAIISQNNPRLLGFHPRYFYFLMISLMKMHSGQALTEDQKWLNWVAWACYGNAMLLEAWQTGCDRVGTVFQFATMGVMNATWTVIAMAKGEV